MFHPVNEDSPEEIIKRLEKLSQWQKEQKKILVEKQNAQRLLLNKEQQEIYSRLGFSTNFSNSKSSDYNLFDETVFKNETENVKNVDKSSTKNVTMNVNTKSKQKFLKRGEGLKARFKIDPDSLKLENLPKYKYANIHKKFKKSTKQNDNKNACNENVKYLKGKNKNAEEFNTQENGLISPSLSLEFNRPLNTNTDRIKTSSDVKLEFDQQKTINQNSPSKKPEQNINKTSIIDNSQSSEQSFDQTNSKSIPPISWAQILDPNNIEPVRVSGLRHNSNPLNKLNSDSSDDDNNTENLSLFELLEKKAEKGSICLDSSSIKRWIHTRFKSTEKEYDEEEEDTLLLISNLEKCRMQPFLCDIEETDLLKISHEDNDDNDNDEFDYDDDDDDDDENQNEKNTAEENKNISHNDDENIDDNDKKEDNELSVCIKENYYEKGTVRFSDDVQINEVFNMESIHSNNEDNLTATSTPIDNKQFEKFKNHLFKDNSIPSSFEDLTLLMNDKTEIESFKKDIQQKSDILKTKLQELENEIEIFQKHNLELIKMKQVHELEKIKLDQDKVELEEKLNDERIKLEIYLHDERIKIEDERKKLEKQMKLNRGPNRKEREEIIKLREQVEMLQKELKDNENKHVSAQGRLRSQIRNLEKDLKDLTFDLDNLKKENKVLRTENTRLNRQESNKVLKEINRTIAKLAAPKSEKISATEVTNKNPKSVTAKVISHNRSKTSINRYNKSKSVPNLCYEVDHADNVKNDSNDDSNIDEEINQNSESDLEFEFSHEDPRGNISSKLTINKKSQDFNKQINKQKYEKSSNGNQSLINNDCSDNFKREITNSDGSKDIWYPNGNLKKISADGMIIRMLYYNKDVKETNIHEGTVKYYYAETNTWHTTYLDGLEILEFPNGQSEHRYKNGVVEVHFPNGSIRIKNPNDEMKLEEWRYPDGTNLIQLKNGDKILSLSNGQKEIHTSFHKRREYPDGTVKFVYPDGSQETRYSNGRVRLKDKDGKLIMDSENL